MNEGFEHIATIDPSEQDLIDAQNKMQVELADIEGNFDLGVEDLENWRKTHGSSFDHFVEKHPEIVTEYLTGDSRSALDTVKVFLKEKHISVVETE